MEAVSVRHLWKEYGNHVVIENLNLEIRDHEFVTIVGASGSASGSWKERKDWKSESWLSRGVMVKQMPPLYASTARSARRWLNRRWKR